MVRTQTVTPSIRTETAVGAARELRREGWVRVRGAVSEDDLAALRHEIETLVESILPGTDPWGHSTGGLPDGPRRLIQRGLSYLPSLMRLAAKEDLLQMVAGLGLEQPAIMQAHGVKLEEAGTDADGESPRWRQDFTYLLGSPNAITVWAPLDRPGPAEPLLEIIPHSHRQGVLAVDAKTSRHIRADTSLSPRDLTLRHQPTADPATVVKAEPGDLLIISAFAVHRRIANSADRMRWTARLRYADLASRCFKAAGYPFGDATNIFHSGYRGAFYDPDR